MRLLLAGIAAFVGGLLLAAPASAVIDYHVGPHQLTGNGDLGNNNISWDCIGGHPRDGASTVYNTLTCSDVQSIVDGGGAGNDTIDLSGVKTADFPNLVQVQIDGQADTDTITGSGYIDTITADVLDTVSAGEGNDVITGGAQVFGGPGNDTITDALQPSGGDGDDLLDTVQHGGDGGPGDDTFQNAGSGPLSGGTGTDRVAFDLPADPQVIYNAQLTVSDSGIDIVTNQGSGRLEWSSIDRLDASMPNNGTQVIDASAFNGSLHADGRGGPDTLIGGPGEDFLTGGAGDDVLTGGAGFDYVDGGSGTDQLGLRDGGVDRGICGDGGDTVTADASDVLTGCETVDLPADTTPPFTVDLSGPAKVKQGKSAVFTFGSSEPGDSFMCKVDKGAFAPCTSPRTVSTKKLKGANHTFSVYAVDAAGNADATPESRDFTVKKKKKKPKKK
jgi:Ca2+-binding RTX toxin-like protein